MGIWPTGNPCRAWGGARHGAWVSDVVGVGYTTHIYLTPTTSPTHSPPMHHAMPCTAQLAHWPNPKPTPPNRGAFELHDTAVIV